ncbi:MAG: hypothetical protein M4579_000576 [Chaenotheca gracillima]|nr:MAG: hypothetical protein M4579_000576 [Chaenotheca gracillima]
MFPKNTKSPKLTRDPIQSHQPLPTTTSRTLSTSTRWLRPGSTPASQPFKPKAPIDQHPPRPDPPALHNKPEKESSSWKSGEGVLSNLAEKTRERAPQATETYIAFGVTDVLYRKCAKQANYMVPERTGKDKGQPPERTKEGVDIGIGEGWWYDDVKLLPTFNTWAQITMLHIYLLATRFRMFAPTSAPAWQQHLLDHFFYDAEHRMTTFHGMAVSAARNKHLKDLFLQYRGAMAAYDEGVCRGDAVLATALWRNVWAQAVDVDLVRLTQMVAYVRNVISRLEALSDEEVAAGKFEFPDPSKFDALVAERSKLVDEPFREEDFKVVKEEEED